jgi:hypothetical protein
MAGETPALQQSDQKSDFRGPLVLLELDANLAFGEESHHFGGLGGFVEADHFFVEFLTFGCRDADDVFRGIRRL